MGTPPGPGWGPAREAPWRRAPGGPSPPRDARTRANPTPEPRARRAHVRRAGRIHDRTHMQRSHRMATRTGPIRVMHVGLGPIGAAVVRQVAERRGFRIVGAVDI